MMILFKDFELTWIPTFVGDDTDKHFDFQYR